MLSGERTGERTLDDEGPSCELLSRALVVTIAILLDAGPGASREPPPPPPPPPPPKPQRPLPRVTYFDMPAVPTAPAEPRPPDPKTFVSASAAAIYDVGTLADDAGGFALGAALWIPYFGVGAGLLVLPRDRLTLGGRDIDYRLVAARLELCSKPPFSLPFGISVCSGLVAGERHAEAHGIDPPLATSGALASFETRLELSRRFLGPFGVFATAGCQAPVLAEPVAVKLPRRAQPIDLPDPGVTFQTGLGARFWLDL